MAADDATDLLTTLADRHGTDKGTRGPRAHHFTSHYHRYLAHRRQEVVSVLEIGIGTPDDPRFTGRSLRMWRDYFPGAVIDGVDVLDRRFLDEERIRTHVHDAGDAPGWYRFLRGRRFDLVVDDGSHRVDHQFVTLAACFHALVPGGVYILEDLVPREGTAQPISGVTHLGPHRSRFNPTGTPRVTEVVLAGWQAEGTLDSEFLSPNDRLYLEANIESVEIIAGAWWPKTAVVVKKAACT